MAKKTNCVINGIEYYRIRKTIGYDKNGNFVLKPFYGKSKSDAEYKYQEWAQNNSRGLKINDKESLTQAMYTWLWEIEKMSGNKESTFERYEGIYRNYVEDSELGYIFLNTIEKITVQQYYNKLFTEGKTYSQIKNLNKLLSKFFRYCVEEGYLARNPCTGIKLDAYKQEEITDFSFDFDDEGKIETFNPKEITNIINNIKNKKLEIIARFALGTGLRQGEILALEESDIKHMTVLVTKSVRWVRVYDNEKKHNYQYQITPPKTKRSKRKVPIPSELERDLKELKKIINIEKLKLGKLYQDNNLLFPSETGTYIDSRNLLRSWKRVFEHIDVPYRKFHALRHTYATQLLKNETQLITVSRLLGHASVKTTEIYAHVLESTKKSEVEALNKLFV